MNTFLIVKQNYLSDVPRFTLYNVESKWFGLKKTYTPFYLNIDNCLTCSFNNTKELIGRLIGHYYNEEKNNTEITDRNAIIEYIKNNTSLILIEKTPYTNDKPKYIGKVTINEYYNIKRK